MKQEIATQLLSMTAYGTLTTGELIVRTGRSPATVIRYLGELEDRGWIERRSAARLGVGRPPVVNAPTYEGLAVLHQAELAWLRKLSGHGVRVLWGPVRAFAHWGVPFVGKADVFVSEPISVEPFDRIVERNPALYDGSVATDEGSYPSAESLVAWAATSGDPRYTAAAAVVLRSPVIDARLLAERTERMHTQNRVGFLAALAGRDLGFSPGVTRERMLPEPAPVEHETEVLARRWRVENPLSSATVRDMERLYGGP